jgi:hypothetical protein
MWISTKGLTKAEEGKVIQVITDYIDQENLIFYGYCFGKFDLIVEFTDNSAKVASNRVCNLQEKISESLKKHRPQIRDPICSSLTLGIKITNKNKVSYRNRSKCPIRTYTFLKPINKYVNLNDILSNLNKDMEIFWNASSYSFLLTTNGENFHETFKKILQYRFSTEKIFSESCTYVGLSWEMSDNECKKKIDALVFVKLKRGFGELKLKNGEDEIWEVKKRLGWFDISLKYKKSAKTLKELKEAILDLRQNHMEDIESTSSILFPKEELPHE